MDASGQVTISAFKGFLLTYFMPEKCYEQFFIHFNFLHGPCLMIFFSKFMGLLILMETLFAPLPQIGKVLWNRSSDALCGTWVLLDLVALSSHAAYCYTQKFPVGAWGESLLGLIQLAVLFLLVLHYRGETLKGVAFLALSSSLMWLLTSPLTPASVVQTLRERSVLLVAAGRMIQARSNYRCGRTGQISCLCVILGFLGSLGRSFSSLQESGRSVSAGLHVVACCVSALMLGQLLIYRSHSVSKKTQ